MTFEVEHDRQCPCRHGVQDRPVADVVLEQRLAQRVVCPFIAGDVTVGAEYHGRDRFERAGRQQMIGMGGKREDLRCREHFQPGSKRLRLEHGEVVGVSCAHLGAVELFPSQSRPAQRRLAVAEVHGNGRRNDAQPG